MGHFKGPDFVSSPQHGIKNVWFSLKWIPVCENQNGDFVCVDMDPAIGGHAGQVIEFTRDYGPTRVLARSFRDWLTNIVVELERGRYRYDDEAGTIISQDGDQM